MILFLLSPISEEFPLHYFSISLIILVMEIKYLFVSRYKQSEGRGGWVFEWQAGYFHDYRDFSDIRIVKRNYFKFLSFSCFYHSTKIDFYSHPAFVVKVRNLRGNLRFWLNRGLVRRFLPTHNGQQLDDGVFNQSQN